MNRKRLLLVDDQAELRQLLRLTFESEQYDIHEADNGMDALRLARSLRPDVILLDVMMPGELDGLQVCEAIRQDPALSSAHIVMLTARAQQTDREACYKAGANAYLSKPFSPLELYQAVEDAETTQSRNV